MNFAESIIKKSSVPIHFLYGRDENGKKAHWFLMCSSAKYDALEKDFGKPNVKAEDYGTIIATGSGHDVTQNTKDLLKEKYDLDFDEYFA